MKEKNYVALHNHSHYSTLDGYATIDEYIKAAKDLGMIGIGLTDHGTASGLYKFITRAQKEGLIPVPGIEFYVAPENPQGAKLKEPMYYGRGGKRAPKYDLSNGAYTHLTVFAYNNVGLSNLFKLTSLSWKKEHFYFKPRIDTNMLAEHSEGLIVTTGCPSSEVSRRFLLGQDEKAYEYASRMKSIFGDNYYVEIMNHKMEDDELERILIPKQIKLAKDLGIKIIATNDSHYAFQEDSIPHERVLAVGTKAKMKDLPRHEGGNRFAFSTPEYHIKTYDEMLELYPKDIAEEALANTIELTMKCQDIKLEYNPHLRPEIDIPEGYTEATYFQKLIYDGFVKKRGHEPKEIQEESVRRIKEEFEVIHSNDFISYFLVVHDYINYAHKKGIGVGAGRGCFVPGTKVKANQGVMRNIENIKVGDKVQTHDTTYQTVENIFIYEVENEDMVRLTLSNGKVIESTSDHMIFHEQEGFMEAKDFSVGDVVLGPKGRRKPYDTTCDSCGDSIKIDKQTYDIKSKKGHYKPEGEYWCYDCVKGNLHKIPAVKEGSIKGALRNKDKDIKEKMSKSLKKHWEENYDERIQRWHEYMETPEYDEYRESRRQFNLKKYSDPVELEQLTKQGKLGYKSGYFTSHRQNKKEIYYASSYEQKALNILETSSQVANFDRYKGRVPYIKPSTGLEHNYLPDFIVEMTDGSTKVIEVKAKWQLSEIDTRAKLEQAEKYFNEQGIKFEVWDEDVLEELNDDWHNKFEIVKVEHYKYTGKVYDIQVENVHNYNVEGVTVHNSVGGSEIAYVLDISNTDPIRFNLLFERFLSPGRGSLYQIEYVSGEVEEIPVSSKKRIYAADESDNRVVYVHELNPGDMINYKDGKEVIEKIFVKIPGSAPDIDTDFHTEGRDEVVQYCIDKYGEENVANIITFGTFKARSSFKAMCTIYGVPPSAANKASSLIDDSASLKELMDPSSPRYNESIDFRRAIDNPMYDEVVDMAIHLENRISETGVHPCGVIISSQPLAGIIPTQVRQRDGKVITQWEYPELEALGLIKMDFLGLDLINTIQQTLENIKLTNESAQDESLKREIPNMREIIMGEMNDPETYKNLQEGNTIGIFQLGSPGVRELLRQAKPQNFMEIANITALYRPGPMKSGAHIQYANRKSGVEEVSYIHEDFIGTEVQEILEETFGLLIFQEQIMLIAGRYAGMTPYETDRLRSAIGKKKMDVMMEMKPKFVEGCLARGASKEAVDTLWETIEVFGQYGFNKSHSVSYAINIYQTIYLKTHYPREFMAAVIQQGFGSPKLREYIQEAVRMGLRIGPVDINNSQVQMASAGIDPTNAYDIVFGFSGVKNLNVNLAEAIVKERNENGNYKSVADFVTRILKSYPITAAPLANLAIAGAFDSFGVSRKLVAEKAKMLIDSSSKKAQQGASLFDMLGGSAPAMGVTEAIEITGEDYDYNEKIKLEADRIGMFVSGHPTAKLGHIAKMYKPVKFSDIIEKAKGKETYHVMGTITQIKTKTNKSGNRSIAVLLDDGSSAFGVYLPKHLVQSLQKGEELERIREAQEKGEKVDTSNYSQQLIDIMRDENIKPMEPLILNEAYVFKVGLRGWGDSKSIVIHGIKRLHTAPDGSLPYEVRVTSESQVKLIEDVAKNHFDKNGSYIKIHFVDGTSVILDTRVKLSLEFIMDMENAIGKRNIITNRI